MMEGMSMSYLVGGDMALIVTDNTLHALTGRPGDQRHRSPAMTTKVLVDKMDMI